jgi:hypothetical protein
MRHKTVLASFVLLATVCSARFDSAKAQCTLPYTLTNGQVADATQVMANLNAIIGCLPAGTTVLGGSAAGQTLTPGTPAYFFPAGSVIFTALSAASEPVPTAGHAKYLFVYMSSAPGSGQSYTFTLIHNGATSTLAATVSGSATTASDTTDSVALAAGDTISMEVNPSSGATGSAQVSWGFVLAP